MGAEDHVHLRHPLEKALPFLLRHTTTHRDHNPRPLLLEGPETPQEAVRLLLRLPSDTARVHDEDIRLRRRGDPPTPCLGQVIPCPQGILFVHLTPEGFNVEGKPLHT